MIVLNLLGLVLAGCATAPPPPPKSSLPMTIDVNKHYQATIEATAGTIIVDLFPREAPITVNNFVTLARKKFYDGTTFHRVVENFVIQGGDPTGTGTGGPGYYFEDETDPEKNPHLFQPGTLAMANHGRNTNGSQFFITPRATPELQGKHTIFGQVHDVRSQAAVLATKKGDTIKSIAIEESNR
jgi:peptidyl-prolyl cis-trans isomerase B (cyclophilin B)